MPSIPNPVRFLLLGVGLALARFDLVDEARVRRATDLSWPRIVTGIARMSKNAVDVAMVGVAVGPTAIAGVGFAGPYWGMAFALGGGIAAGTIALVSQRFGATAHDELGQAVRSSIAIVFAVTLPLGALFYLFPRAFIAVLTDDPTTIRIGAEYLQVVALGVPFAGLNLIGSRAYIGADDAWTPMIVRSGGAVTNIVLNAVFIFGLGMGAVGAALGTVLANVAVAGVFAIGLFVRRVPGTQSFPVRVAASGSYFHRETVTDLVDIGLPVVGRNMVWTVARFPMLAIVALFGPAIVAAYVIARRIWGLMNTPGWGFGLAASSLVGQELGSGDELLAEKYGRELVRHSAVTHLVIAVVVALFAEQIVWLFISDPSNSSVPTAVLLVYAACVAVGAQGVKGTSASILDASGDTRWPFYSQVLGMFGFVLPIAYLGATTSLGVLGLAATFLVESGVPAVINYYRFTTGKWKSISREFRPDAPADD